MYQNSLVKRIIRLTLKIHTYSACKIHTKAKGHEKPQNKRIENTYLSDKRMTTKLV